MESAISMAKEPWDWTLEDLKSLVDNHADESVYVDFKSCESFRDLEKAKNEISKDVSAFANAGGGTIIYGILEDESRRAAFLEAGVDRTTVTREWIDQVIHSRIHPKVEGVRINPIPSEDADRFLYVISIPQSRRGPHQASDKKFYTRRNFLSEPMEEYEIRDVLTRERAPDLTVQFYFRRLGARIHRFKLDWSNPETVHTLELNAALQNRGGGQIQSALVLLYVDQRLAPETSQPAVNHRDLFLVREGGRNAVRVWEIQWRPRGLPLFRGIEYLLLDQELQVHFKSPWLEGPGPPFILWEARAPSMEPKSGFARLVREGDSVTIKPESTLPSFELERESAGRDFMREPDRALAPRLPTD